MLDITTIMDRLTSHASSTGVFGSVSGYEPAVYSDNDIDCAIFLDEIQPINGSGLASTSVAATFTVDIYANTLPEPYDETELKLVRALDILMTAYNGDFTLDGAIRGVDLFGLYTQGVLVTAEYIKNDTGLFKVLTIRLPLIVNDVWDQNE